MTNKLTDYTRRAHAEALSKRVGPRAYFSASEFCERTGFNEHRFRAWRLGQNGINLAEFMVIASNMGPLKAGYVNDVMSIIGLTGTFDPDGPIPDDFEISAELGSAINVVTDALRDGHVDHLERRLIVKKLRDLQDLCARATVNKI